MAASSSEACAALKSLIALRIGPDATPWIESTLSEITVETWGPKLNEVSRQMGRRPLIAGFSERDAAELDGVCGPMKIGHWRTDESIKTLVLASLAEGSEHPFKTLFSIYDQGDSDIRVAALRAVNFVTDDDVASGLELIHDAGRTYLDELMGAAWCNNPFTAQHLNGTEYRKAVLKALFCNLPIDGFIGLNDRANEEMANSLHDFADEREAAGREVPDSVWIVAAHHPRPGLVARLIGRLEHPLPKQRLTAAIALGNAKDPRALSFLKERHQREESPDVKDALVTAIEQSRGAVAE